jgi:ATP-dependent Lon protease
VQIANRHLTPKQMEAHGLKDGELVFTDEALRGILRHYTREAGVRTLERELAKVARKSLRQILENKIEKVELTLDNLGDFLGVRRFRYGMGEEEDQIGAVTGLAWTEVGGELLTIEAVTVPGKGQIKTTGKLGEVMQESIQAAMSFVKARAPAYGIKPSIFARKDIHVHLPEGAVPKDGPSAGIGMVTAMISTLSGVAVRRDVAMTGEVTLRGKVLEIGGVKEKVMSAYRSGLREVILPKSNEKDLRDLPDEVREGKAFTFVQAMDEVLRLALLPPPPHPLADHAPPREEREEEGMVEARK